MSQNQYYIANPNGAVFQPTDLCMPGGAHVDVTAGSVTVWLPAGVLVIHRELTSEQQTQVALDQAWYGVECNSQEDWLN